MPLHTGAPRLGAGGPEKRDAYAREGSLLSEPRDQEEHRASPLSHRDPRRSFPRRTQSAGRHHSSAFGLRERKSRKDTPPEHRSPEESRKRLMLCPRAASPYAQYSIEETRAESREHKRNEAQGAPRIAGHHQRVRRCTSGRDRRPLTKNGLKCALYLLRAK